MSATDSVTYTLERNWEMVEAATSGLDDEALTRQPAEQSNSIAWIFGHITRVTDMFILRRLQSKPELWISDGWCQKYGMTHNPGGLGMGQTAEEIAVWTAPAWEVQLGYFEAVKITAREYISSSYGRRPRKACHISARSLEARPHRGYSPRAIGVRKRGPRWPNCVPARSLQRDGLVSLVTATGLRILAKRA